jgi:hypothetical protein
MISIERATEGDVNVGVDRSASPGLPYWYRLAARDGQGTVLIGDAVSISGEEAADFELLRVTPNPGPGPVRFEFALAREARVEIDVYDILGRHIAAALRGTVPAGAHSVRWSGTTGPITSVSGLFWVRYRYPGGQQVKSFVLSK